MTDDWPRLTFCYADPPYAITLRRGVVGAKPAAFAAWLRVLLGYREGDQLIDMFPGSGAIGRDLDTLRLDL